MNFLDPGSIIVLSFNSVTVNYMLSKLLPQTDLKFFVFNFVNVVKCQILDPKASKLIEASASAV